VSAHYETKKENNTSRKLGVTRKVKDDKNNWAKRPKSLVILERKGLTQKSVRIGQTAQGSSGTYDGSPGTSKGISVGSHIARSSNKIGSWGIDEVCWSRAYNGARV
jgi:hypothetical protein